jgi:putative ABC transport system substrate-binding protein
MNKTGQGALHQSKFLHLLRLILLSSILCFLQFASKDTLAQNTLQHEKNMLKRHVYVMSLSNNALHADIAQKLTDSLNHNQPDIIISKITPENEIIDINNNTDIIVVIGPTSIETADREYPNTKKLFISTDPNKYKLDNVKNKNDAILYMTQSYCRQIKFIKLLNPNWNAISIISSEEKPIDRTTIQQCAKSQNIKTYIASITARRNLTDTVKLALNHSDVLLAFPDKNIYNNRSVKNILLTSYRNRKPIIGFSKNFVNAGALAAVHSTADQIANNANKLIDEYYKQNKKFKQQINHPENFNVSTNRQVFRALNLPIPDIEKLKKTLINKNAQNTGAPQ